MSFSAVSLALTSIHIIDIERQQCITHIKYIVTDILLVMREQVSSKVHWISSGLPLNKTKVERETRLTEKRAECNWMVTLISTK